MTPGGGGLRSLEVAEGAAVDLPELDGFDPERVSLVGLRAAEWEGDAACFGLADRALDPWHPDDDLSRDDHHAAVALAREVCATCPVRRECLALGLALMPLGGAHGMFAGYVPAELRQIARARAMASRVVAQHGTRARRVAGCDCYPCRRAHADYVAGIRAAERYAETDRDPDVDPILGDRFEVLAS